MELDCAIFGQLSQVKWHVPKSCKARKFLEGTFLYLRLWSLTILIFVTAPGALYERS